MRLQVVSVVEQRMSVGGFLNGIQARRSVPVLSQIHRESRTKSRGQVDETLGDVINGH
jgi:hypothetical protein